MIDRMFKRVLPLILGGQLLLALPSAYADTTTPAPAPEKPLPHDPVLQRALDVVTSLEVYQKR